MNTSQFIATARAVRIGALAFTFVAALGLPLVHTGGGVGGDQAFAHPGNGNGNGGGNGKAMAMAMLVVVVEMGIRPWELAQATDRAAKAPSAARSAA